MFRSCFRTLAVILVSEIFLSQQGRPFWDYKRSKLKLKSRILFSNAPFIFYFLFLNILLLLFNFFFFFFLSRMILCLIDGERDSVLRPPSVTAGQPSPVASSVFFLRRHQQTRFGEFFEGVGCVSKTPLASIDRVRDETPDSL